MTSNGMWCYLSRDLLLTVTQIHIHVLKPFTTRLCVKLNWYILHGTIIIFKKGGVKDGSSSGSSYPYKKLQTSNK